MVNIPTSISNLKTKVDEVDVGKSKTFSLDLEKLRDVVDNEVMKNTKFKTIKTKFRKEKTPDATNLIHTNQCNTGKQNSE